MDEPKESAIPTETTQTYQDADNGQIVPNSGPTGESEAIADKADDIATDPAAEQNLRDNVDIETKGE